MKILYVEWDDACTHAGWTEIEDRSLTSYQCKTLGFLIRETDKDLVIASTLAGHEANAIIAIPKAWISKRKEYKLKL